MKKHILWGSLCLLLILLTVGCTTGQGDVESSASLPSDGSSNVSSDGTSDTVTDPVTTAEVTTPSEETTGAGEDTGASEDTTTETTVTTEETQAMTTQNNAPIYVATAPEWDTEDISSPTVEYDPSLYSDVVKGNAHVTFSASSMESSALAPALCFDGDPSTRWSSDQHDVDGCWICVDFGYPVSINGLFVTECKQWGRISAWDAQYYNEDTGAWVTVMDEFSFDDDVYYGLSENTPPTYRFRLRFYESTSLAISLYEIRLMGTHIDVPEGTPPHRPAVDPTTGIPDGLYNLALRGTYTASSSENAGNPAELGPYFCFDEKDDTRWSTVFHDLRESWIAVDFGREVTIHGYIVNEVTNWGHVTSYSVQVWNGTDWQTVARGTTFPSTKEKYLPLDTPVTTTRFRLLFHDGETLSETVTISEIRVLGQE